MNGLKRERKHFPNQCLHSLIIWVKFRWIGNVGANRLHIIRAKRTERQYWDRYGAGVWCRADYVVMTDVVLITPLIGGLFWLWGRTAATATPAAQGCQATRGGPVLIIFWIRLFLHKCLEIVFNRFCFLWLFA